MVIVSLDDAEAPRALRVCVPLTTAYRNSWYEIPIGKKPFLREPSYANVQGIQAVQDHELEGPVGRLHPAEMAGIRAALARMLEII